MTIDLNEPKIQWTQNMIGRVLLEGNVEKKTQCMSTLDKNQIWFTQFLMHEMNPINDICTVASPIYHISSWNTESIWCEFLKISIVFGTVWKSWSKAFHKSIKYALCQFGTFSQGVRSTSRNKDVQWASGLNHGPSHGKYSLWHRPYAV